MGLGLGISSSLCHGECPPMDGVASFAFGNSYHFDGVNDQFDMGGATSSTCFNPFKQTDWFASMWLKADGTRFNHNKAPFGCGRFVNDAGFASIVFFNGALGGNIIRIYSNFKNVNFAYNLPSATAQAWTHYAWSVEIVSSTVQRAKLYLNGVFIESIDFDNVVYTDTDTVFRIGGWPNNGSPINAWMNQPVFGEFLPSDSDITDLYNAGAGADPLSVFPSLKSGYLGTEPVGQTTGTISDVKGNQDLTMSNILSPFGVVSDKPA